jgi:hypothetical protein
MIAETITYLQNGNLGLKLVAGAAEFQAAIEAKPTATPAAYVLAADETGGPNHLGNGLVLQPITASIAIVLVTRNVADPKGAAATADMITLRRAVRTLLLGWAPTAVCEPYEYERGALAAFKDGHLWWQDVYRTSYLEKAQ